MQHKCNTRVVVVPANIDGNIHHKYIETALGFDTASKVCSQLIGNMLTDSASAIKYWYFIKLMGGSSGHLTLECGLRTHPNMVLVGEESAFHGETLHDIVGRVCDNIQTRAEHGKNFGAVLIPEGLLYRIPAFQHLFDELNAIVMNSADHVETIHKLSSDPSFVEESLTKHSHAYFMQLPQSF